MVRLDSPPTVSNPSLTYDYDLAIAGGGIIGLTLASALSNSGLKVVVIEAKPQSVAAAKGQAYAVHLLSGRIFAGIGVWDKILPQIAHFSHVQLSDADCPQAVNFETTDLGTEVLGYVAEHQALLKPLQDFVSECPNVTYLCPAQVVDTSYQPSGVKISLQMGDELKTIRTRLIVAADGAKSRTRQAAGINTRGWQYWQSCIVAFVKPEKGHNNTAYEKFWRSGPFAVLPLPDNLCRIVWTAPHKEAKAIVALNNEDFLTELTRRCGTQMGELQLVGDRFIFPVQLMQSDRYVLPRLALVGDAAHCCHPVGGQGLNMGIRDAAALAQVLQQAHVQGEDIGDLAILKRYESWRKQENLTILGFTDLLDRVFSNNFLPVVIVRRIGLLILRRVPPIKVFALKLMTGLKGRTPEIAQRL